MLHPGARFHPRLHRHLPRPRLRAGPPPYLLGGIHDAAHGRGDRFGGAVAAHVRQGVELDHPGERGPPDLVRDVQRPRRYLRLGVMETKFVNGMGFFLFLSAGRGGVRVRWGIDAELHPGLWWGWSLCRRLPGQCLALGHGGACCRVFWTGLCRFGDADDPHTQAPRSLLPSCPTRRALEVSYALRLAITTS